MKHHRLVYEGRLLTCREGETVLDALIRQGRNPPFSCRHGVCLVCLQRCTDGTPTEASQRALRPGLQRLGYFLPCKCVPEGDLDLAPPRPADLFGRAVVQQKELLAKDVCRLLLEPATSLYYHAGQFVNLRREDGLTRPYSLASLPAEDPYLEVHVKRLAGGTMSGWIFDDLAVGDELEFQGPEGRCYYVPGTQKQDILLVGTGTGLAPLAGILRDALHVGHEGRLRFLHGSRTLEGLYLHRWLTELAARHPNLEYLPCISGDDAPAGFMRGRVHEVAFGGAPDLHGWRVFAAGHPRMVERTRELALRAGASPDEIHVDPYETRAPEEVPVAVGESGSAAGGEGRSFRDAPDPEMWAALGGGVLLNGILTDFYGRVFEDPLLSPYFEGVTKERLIGQVYGFMRDAFTGQKLYFGLRPRTGHHWMVISDAIFDYRERLMEDCLRRHGLSEELVRRWRRFEEGFRADIVKATPWKLVVDGVERPLDGFGEEELSAGTVCDGCQRAIDAGERVRYHLRLGHTYCGECAFRESGASIGAPA